MKEGDGKETTGDSYKVDIYDDDSYKGLPAFGGATKRVIFLLGILVSCLSIYEAIFGNFEPSLQRPLHVFLMCTLTFIMYPSKFFKPNGQAECALPDFHRRD